MINFTIPENLEPEAKAYIQSVLDMLENNGFIDNVDDAALQMLAYNYSTFIKANKIVDEQGLTAVNSRGLVCEHPAVKIARDAQSQALKVMTQFGLTAKSRSKLQKLNNADNTESPLEEFIKKSGVQANG